MAVKINKKMVGPGQNLKTALLFLFDQAFNKKAWHGTNLRGSIRGLSAAQALWRPSPKRHNIWELTIHAAYWKYAVWRRLTGHKRSSFEIKGSNWLKAPQTPDEGQWREIISLLENYHKLLRRHLENLPESQLLKPAPESEMRISDLIVGVASHDLYHAGQIQLLKRLQKGQ